MTRAEGGGGAHWSPVMRELAETVGEERTLELVRRFGGLVVTWISRNPERPHRWREVITEPEDWARVCARFGGTRLHLSQAKCLDEPLKVRIIDMLEMGLTTDIIALQLHCGQRYVMKVAAALGTPKRRRAVDPRQLPLLTDED